MNTVVGFIQTILLTERKRHSVTVILTENNKKSACEEEFLPQKRNRRDSYDVKSQSWREIKGCIDASLEAPAALLHEENDKHHTKVIRRQTQQH